MPVQHGGEVVGAITGAVVGDDPLDVGDAVCGEECPGSTEESDGGGGFLIG